MRFKNEEGTYWEDPKSALREFKYLGSVVNKNNQYSNNVKQQFSKVRKAFFSLQEFGIKSYSLQPQSKSFIYKSRCLSKFLYPIGVIRLNSNHIQELEISQNMLIRYMFGYMVISLPRDI